MTAGIRRMAFLVVALGVGALLAWAFIEGRKELQQERERDMPIKLPPRVQSISGGGVKIVLDRQTQDLTGIQVQGVRQTREGMVVPASTLIRQEGKLWVYCQSAPEEFIRKPVRLGQAAPEHGVALEGLSPQEKVVTVGAQMLLSEEFKVQIQVLAEGR